MQEKGVAPESTEPSLDELHRMFEEKDRVREKEKKRHSRHATKILVAIPLILLVVYLCVPDTREPSAPASESDLAGKAAEIQRQLENPGAGAPEAGTGSAEADKRRGDMQFALDLLRYVNPENAAPKPSGTTPPAPEKK